MEIDTLLGAFRDFEKKGEKETCPILDQFLSHVAKTGETMIQWSQFKGYFLFKLEKVMDDFKASCPEQRGPANPNVEYIPFEEMKQRILKIVNGYNGIPFTIQRLCELLTEPKRNYTGTDKFLRGVEKNVMVVSCVYPTSEKKGPGCVNRMNGVMFPGNTSAFPDRGLKAEPSSTQSEVVENGVDKSASDDSPDPSHNQATVSESDLPEQRSDSVESGEAQETDERNDPVSSSSNNSSDEGVSSAETPSACPSSSTELTAEGSTTAEISSDSSETADDTMEQD
ncbi:serine threonine- phosphatase 4 regulatory subunit 2-A-like protein [Labeo rohita]|uniref:Serine threonine-phosphatase 4 regulatory subunit 2-A-like protein n=1 Tax=Labeo rohita TaxID=84645 RepID=A0A498MZN2_LABRO|nr:serine threonine- phosphatase 4 regulatory subunit 2-A-like protein [Labeo rohita]RXN25353.1 serine threonine- phosphatase 4 regulatory subunit 2-A-like protein [Labeo rohita]